MEVNQDADLSRAFKHEQALPLIVLSGVEFGVVEAIVSEPGKARTGRGDVAAGGGGGTVEGLTKRGIQVKWA